MRRSFSLIEIIIAIVIITIALGGLASVMQQVLYHSQRPEVTVQAVSLAEAEAERILVLSFASVNDENRDSPQNYSGNLDSYSWEIRIDSIDTVQPSLGSDASMQRYKVVEIRIHHASLGYYSLRLLKANYST